MLTTQSKASRRSLILIGSLFLCGTAVLLSSATARAQTSKFISAAPQTASLPFEISPEGVLALDKVNTPYVLINADQPETRPDKPAPQIREIFYTTSPSVRTAYEQVVQRRSAKSATVSEASKLASQRLTGTPLDWQRAGLPLSRNPLPERPLFITPKQLSEAIHDGVELRIIDMRPRSPEDDIQPFPKAVRLLPHEVATEPSHLSKQNWIVLVDSGDRVAQPIAERLFKQGYILTTVLEGGYPAWVAATSR